MFNPFQFHFSQLQKIIDDKNEAKEEEKYLAALTAGNRVAWAQARNKYFKKAPNKYSLESIEKVCQCACYSPNFKFFLI